ncbi:hypothetical protein QBC47DRAFT_355870 [Echria macrotheca]|uniref:Uncharacterized protein n=1 Tax=Echria macrotheca TaxID=438768 RepID=A0AAJ0FB30_9PEZI|nr:hypothetical protein QBC47DRAFT_355870 [Echria macrotheca]
MATSVEFTGVRRLFSIIDWDSRDSFTVTNVSPHQFAKLEQMREKRKQEMRVEQIRHKGGRKTRFRDYNSITQTLLITTPTSLHEKLHRPLYNDFFRQIRNMGLGASWINMGSRTLAAPQGLKEGDSTGGPSPQRSRGWPTLVIEAVNGTGIFETMGQSEASMRQWFSVSNHEVKVVVIAEFRGPNIGLVLQKWEEKKRWNQERAEPMLTQCVALTRNPATDPVTYDVAGGDLILPFQSLFLRDPGPGEGDLVFSVEDMHEYADNIWQEYL